MPVTLVSIPVVLPPGVDHHHVGGPRVSSPDLCCEVLHQSSERRKTQRRMKGLSEVNKTKCQMPSIETASKVELKSKSSQKYILLRLA